MEGTRVTKTKLILGFLILLHASITCTHSADTISANQIIRYNETIVSPQETFELGFFNPGNSTNHYVGIWYKKRSTGTIVWVANRNTPLTGTSGELTLTDQGVLIIRDSTGNVLWSSVNSDTSVDNPIGQLLDTGNFIIYDGSDVINQEIPIWQSFDFITDTLLPGMKLGRFFVTGVERYQTSWKSRDDPASGELSYRIDTRGYPQTILTGGPNIMFRGGPWNGLRFTGIPNLIPNPIYNFTFVLNQREVYYRYDLLNASVLTREVVQPDGGGIQRLLWIDSKQEWVLYSAALLDYCDLYARCGAFGRCNTNNSPHCGCLEGFEPRSPDQWKARDWSQGCRRTIPLNCGPREEFKKYSNLKLPETQGSSYYPTMTLLECEKTCKSICSCTAYTNSNISGSGSGCLLWFGDLIDVRTFDENGDTLYIRMSPSEIGNRKGDKNSIGNRKGSSEGQSSSEGKSSSGGIRVRVIAMVTIAFVILVILVCICLFYRFNRKKQHQQGKPNNEAKHDHGNKNDEDLELPVYGLSTLVKATNDFSMNYKLGEGGFGPVYKGVLEDGREIAVKRLAKTSTQGLHEFKNEVISISKLQHRNLVRLLGYCTEGAEKMLIYEYMPNKGLDSFIFDRTRSELLNWPARDRIINGIACGLLYIHRDSRLRMVHRDLKVSNILVDKDMNPKISDFGTARSFGGNQIEANTNRVVGTYGYMAPEYAGNGIFSIKSDVYSFGVVVLEIVSGEKNRGFIHKEHYNNLMGHNFRFIMSFFKAVNDSTKDHLILPDAYVRDNNAPMEFTDSFVSLMYDNEKNWFVKMQKVGEHFAFVDGWKNVIEDIGITNRSLLIFKPFKPYADYIVYVFQLVPSSFFYSCSKFANSNLIITSMIGEKGIAFCQILFEPDIPILMLPDIFVKNSLDANSLKKQYFITMDKGLKHKVKITKSGNNYFIEKGWSKVMSNIPVKVGFFMFFMMENSCTIKLSLFRPNGTEVILQEEGQQNPTSPVLHTMVNTTYKFNITARCRFRLPKELSDIVTVGGNTNLRIMDVCGVLWDMTLRVEKSGQRTKRFAIRNWSSFLKANKIEEGDMCYYEYSHLQGILTLSRVEKM